MDKETFLKEVNNTKYQSSKKLKFAIGIPTYNRADLLLESLLKYFKDFPSADIHIIDNGNQDLSFLKYIDVPNIFLYTASTNMGVAASWNFLCNKIFSQYEYALILNDDVYLGYDEYFVNKNIIELEKLKGTQKLLITSHISWSIFIISKQMYNYVGNFDETFHPAYYEDSDYMYRMKLLGLCHIVDRSLNPSIVRVSMTHELAPDMVNESMKINRLRYIEKWGNIPFLEIFKSPYNKNL